MTQEMYDRLIAAKADLMYKRNAYAESVASFNALRNEIAKTCDHKLPSGYPSSICYPKEGDKCVVCEKWL